ncbi:MAG: hypothetical protein H6Q63_1075, partial [Firmicutes bacterium]|nr:hypothetical protein [Bacillota bacterium]
GTVVVLVLSNNNIEVYGCDEVGKVMTGLQRTIKL